MSIVSPIFRAETALWGQDSEDEDGPNDILRLVCKADVYYQRAHPDEPNIVAQVADWIDAGGDVNGTTSTSDAAWDGLNFVSALCVHSGTDPDVLRLLLDRGARVDDIDLMRAAANGHTKAAQVLLDYGYPPVNLCEENGCTALHEAAKSYSSKMVALLLAHGADVHAYSEWTEGFGKYHGTPLLWAAQRGGHFRVDIIKLLLQAGADLDDTDDDGMDFEHHVRASQQREYHSNHGTEKYRKDHWTTCETLLSIVDDVRRAGSWARYVFEPRLQVFLLFQLCRAPGGPAAKRRLAHYEKRLKFWTGCCVTDAAKIEFYRRKVTKHRALASLAAEGPRASPTTDLSTGINALPTEMVWKIISFWRTARDAPGNLLD